MGAVALDNVLDHCQANTLPRMLTVQPLAALHTYAENSVIFLDRKRASEARDNVGRIVKLTDRMSTISRHLRNFSREPNQALGPI